MWRLWWPAARRSALMHAAVTETRAHGHRAPAGDKLPWLGMDLARLCMQIAPSSLLPPSATNDAPGVHRTSSYISYGRELMVSNN
jgi:hypothetical protein